MNIYSLLLILIGVLQYTSLYIVGYLSFFVLVFIIYVYFLYNKQKIYINSNFKAPIFSVIFWMMFICSVLIFTTNYSVDLINVLTTTILVILYSVVYSNIDLNKLEIIYYDFLKIGFLIGCFLLMFKLVIGIEVMNENSITILLFPYLIYLLIKGDYSKLLKIVIYIVGVVLFYLSDGRTMLIVFVLFPLMYFIAKSRVLSIVFLIGCVVFSLLSPIFLKDALLAFNGVLSSRPSLWIVYMEDYLSNPMYYLVGSSEFVLNNAISQEAGWDTLHSHNTYIHTLWTEGVGKLIFIVLAFVVIAVIKSNVKDTVFFRTIVLSITFVQVVEFVEITGISYFSIVYLMALFFIIVEGEKHNVCSATEKSDKLPTRNCS